MALKWSENAIESIGIALKLFFPDRISAESIEIYGCRPVETKNSHVIPVACGLNSLSDQTNA